MLINERNLSKNELSKREEIIKSMKKNKRKLVKKYGAEAEKVMYGRATNIAKKVAENDMKNMNPKLKEAIKSALMNPEKAYLNKDRELSPYEEILKTLEYLKNNTDEDARNYIEDNIEPRIEHINRTQKNIDNIKKRLTELSSEKKGSKNAKSVLPYDYFDLINKSREQFGLEPLKDINELSVDELLDHLGENIKGIEKAKSDINKLISTAADNLKKFNRLNQSPVSSNEKTSAVEATAKALEGVKPKNRFRGNVYRGEGDTTTDEEPATEDTNEKRRGAAIEKAMQKEDLDLGHEDNEPHMLKADLYKIGKYAMELYQMVDQFEGQGEVDFPAWWQSKITNAASMISSAKHYLEFELKEPEIDAMVDVAQDAGALDEIKAKVLARLTKK